MHYRRGKIKRPHLYDVEERELRLLNLLEESDVSMSTQSIAWELRESKACVKRMLYDLDKDKQIERLQRSPPIWKIKTDDVSNSIPLKAGRGVLMLC
mmetsp:Transcript_6530/g.9991  ORF Transcript_6530/g.9991 Transcript_6530/m.9991 type:complete len:97 (+) Transcript_6530:210-500(+)